MKRFSWIIFLCAFLVMMVSPASATNYYIKLSGDSEATSGDAFKIWSNDDSSFVNDNDTSHDFSALNAVLASGDTVSFDEGKIFKISGDVSLDIHSRDITIIGNGAVIDGQRGNANGNTRTEAFIQISGDNVLNVKISGLTFTNISRSVAATGNGGGAISVTNSADNAEITDCVFASNEIFFYKAQSSTLEYIGGAAIFAKDVAGLKIDSCDFISNFISGDHGDGGKAGGNTAKVVYGGGAIYAYALSKDTTIKIINSDFQSNDLWVDSTGSGGSGGAITGVVAANNQNKDGNAVWLSLDISSTNFANNYAGHSGGAIYVLTDIDASTNKHGSADLTIKDSVFSGNYVGKDSIGEGGAKNSGSRGGAIMARVWYGLVSIDIKNTLFENNTASSDQLTGTRTGSTGGALGMEAGPGGYISAKVNGSNFDSNKSHYGGAIGSLGGGGSIDLVVENSTFEHNSLVASVDEKGPYTSLFPVGSAIASRAQKYLVDGSNSTNVRAGRAFTTIINSTFYSNDAIYGGAVANIVSDDDTIVSTDIIHSTFVNNGTKSADSGADIVAVMTGAKGKTSSDIRVYDSIFYNNNKDIYAVGIQSADAVVSLDRVAYINDKLMKGSIATILSKDTVYSMDVASFDNASNDNADSLKVTINVANEEKEFNMKYFTLSAGDLEALISGGSSKDVAIANYPTNDFLGFPYDTDKPSLGAVQATNFNISVTLESNDEGQYVLGPVYRDVIASVDLNISASYESFDTKSVDWAVEIDAADDEDSGTLTASVDVGGKLTASADKAGEYTFTVTAKGMADSVYANYSDKMSFVLIVSGDKMTAELTGVDTYAEDNDDHTRLVVGKEYTFTSADLVELAGTYNDVKIEDEDFGNYTLKWASASADVTDDKFTVTFTAEGTNYLPISVTVTSKDDTNISADAEVSVEMYVEGQTTLTLSADTKAVTARRGAEITSIVISSDPAAKSWAISGDLSEIGLTGSAADGKYTISGTVPATAEIGAYNYTLVASNDDETNKATASIDVTITVLDVAPVLGTSYSFTAQKGVATTYTVAPTTAGTSVKWTLDEDAPSWVTVDSSSDAGLVLAATADKSEKTNTTYTFKVVAANYSESTTAVTEVSADVTVTVVGSILSGDSNGYTSGTYTFPATRVTGTNAAGQPTATTTSVFRNGAGETMLSIDITITGESSDLRTRVAQEYSTSVSVDVAIDVRDANYTVYAYSFDMAGAPFMSVLGEKSGTSADLVSGDVHHDFVLAGTARTSGDYEIVVTFNALVSGDIPILCAVDSMDMSLIVDVALVETEGDGVVDESGNATVSHLSEPMTLEQAVKEILDHIDNPAEVKNLTLPAELTDLSTSGLIALKAAMPELTAIDISNSNMLPAELNFSSSELDWLTGITMDDQKTVQEVTLTGSSITNFSANGSQLSTLNVANSDVVTLSVNNTQLKELNTSNCDELVTLNANQCEKLDTLIVEDCGKLETLSAQGKPHTRGQTPTGIRKVDLARCIALTTLDLSSNRILRQHLDASLGLGALKTVDIGDQHERIKTMSGRFNLAKLFFDETILDSSVEDEKIQLTEDQAEELARVTAVTGLDAVGRPIDANYNAATGEIVFAGTPTTFKYAYDTKAATKSTLDAEIEPSNFEPADPSTPGEGSGSGGGCEVFGAGMFSMMILLAGAFMKRR